MVWAQRAVVSLFLGTPYGYTKRNMEMEMEMECSILTLEISHTLLNSDVMKVLFNERDTRA